MYDTPNMSLVVWDQPGDFFGHPQLAADFITIDEHDHSNGRGVQINTPGIAPSAITTALLADASVTQPKLGINAVGTTNIQDGAVTGSKIASGSITATDLQNNSITYQQLDVNVVPLGTVVTWYRSPGSANVPGGNWEICDGRLWSTISNTMGSGGLQLTTGNIPDMRGQFAQGADINGTVAPGIGTSGGAATVDLQHGHVVDEHYHGVPAHIHGISADGLHSHTFMGGLATWSRTNAFNLGFQTAYYPYNNSPNVTAGVWANTFYTLYIKNLGTIPQFNNIHGDTPGQAEQWIDGATPMDNDGNHNHSGATAASNYFYTDQAGTYTDQQLGEVSVIPPNTALLHIMRVR
jgi:hypothetical protein